MQACMRDPVKKSHCAITFLTCDEVKPVPAKKIWPGYFDWSRAKISRQTASSPSPGPPGNFSVWTCGTRATAADFSRMRKSNLFFDKNAIVGFEAKLVLAGVA